VSPWPRRGTPAPGHFIMSAAVAHVIYVLELSGIGLRETCGSLPAIGKLAGVKTVELIRRPRISSYRA
jgi:hypothetical protein